MSKTLLDLDGPLMSRVVSNLNLRDRYNLLTSNKTVYKNLSRIGRMGKIDVDIEEMVYFHNYVFDEQHDWMDFDIAWVLMKSLNVDNFILLKPLLSIDASRLMAVQPNIRSLTLRMSSQDINSVTPGDRTWKLIEKTSYLNLHIQKSFTNDLEFLKKCQHLEGIQISMEYGNYVMDAYIIQLVNYLIKQWESGHRDNLKQIFVKGSKYISSQTAPEFTGIEPKNYRHIVSECSSVNMFRTYPTCTCHILYHRGSYAFLVPEQLETDKGHAVKTFHQKFVDQHFVVLKDSDTMFEDEVYVDDEDVFRNYLRYAF